MYLGKFNTYAHQVTGDIYAIDEYTFLIKNFFYDGLGQGRYSLETVKRSNEVHSQGYKINSKQKHQTINYN